MVSSSEYVPCECLLEGEGEQKTGFAKGKEDSKCLLEDTICTLIETRTSHTLVCMFLETYAVSLFLKVSTG